MSLPGSPATRARLSSAIAALVLAALGVAYYLTYEPAPEVSITWREGTTWLRRSQLERQFGLARGRDIADWRVWYDLVDVRPSTIGGLQRQPEVAAIDGLDMATHTVPADAPYGDGWMWIGPRLPVLRYRGVVPGIIVMCVAVLAVALPAAFGGRRRFPRFTRLQTIAAVVLAGLGAVWYASYERAPGMSVRWSEDVTGGRRGALEREFRLARGRAVEGRTFTYDLLDIRSANVQALIEHPQVDDTGYLDRASFTVPANAPFGQGGMWIGTRLPVLRTYGVVHAIAAGCALFLFYPIARTAWRRGSRRAS